MAEQNPLSEVVILKTVAAFMRSIWYDNELRERELRLLLHVQAANSNREFLAAISTIESDAVLTDAFGPQETPDA